MDRHPPPALDYAKGSDFPPHWARLLMRPIGWPTLILTALASLTILWHARVPSTISAFLFTLGLYGPLAIWWFLRLAISVCLHDLYPRAPRTPLRPFLYPVLIVAAVTITTIAGIPQHIAFLTAKPGMTRLIPLVQRGQIPPGTNRPVGLLTVRPELCRDGASILFSVEGAGGMMDEAGYGYRTDLPADAQHHQDGSDQWRRLDGNWFHVYRGD